MFDWIYSPEAWVALGTLMALEVVLGIDNIIFISILVGKLPPQQRDSARRIGLGLAMLSRLLLLLSLAWIIGLTAPWFSVFGPDIFGRDFVLIVGGFFLLAKSTHEIHDSLEGGQQVNAAKAASSYLAILVQIMLLDVVFSLDSVITAVGLVEHLSIMVIAVMASVVVMLFAAKPIGEFVDKHPTVKVLALSFLMLIGFTLVAEGLDVHVPKGYIYFAMAFSVCVEMVNLRVRRGKQREAVKLHKKIEPE
jgi:predicted tellurium resistance membrane protein TerC